MTFTFTLADLVTIVTLLVGVVTLWFGLKSRLERLEHRIDGIASVLKSANTEVLSLIATIIRIFQRRKLIDEQDIGTILACYTQIASRSIDTLLTRESQKGNPLSQEEVNRLRGYMDKMGQGIWLTREELDDYNRLVRKLEQERPNDPGIWPLIALGAFLFGLYLGSQK